MVKRRHEEGPHDVGITQKQTHEARITRGQRVEATYRHDKISKGKSKPATQWDIIIQYTLEAAYNPLKWSPRGVILASQTSDQYLWDDHVIQVSERDLAGI